MAATAKKVTKSKPAAKPTTKPAAKSATKPSGTSAPKEGTAPATKPTAAPKLKVVTTSTDTAAVLITETGAALLSLLKETPDAEGAAAITRGAQSLAKGEALPNAALRELKAAVNAVAAQLRRADKAALARQWSRANRGVRRLERASRTAS
jgi:hypothetical protein